MADNLSCQDKGIPEHLWKGEKEALSVFDDDEVLYRRFKTTVPNYSTGDKADATEELNIFTAELFQIKQDSYNRSKFCNTEKDVLYNDDGDYKHNYGIFSIKASSTVLTNETVQVNDEIKTICMEPIHDPLSCNYPHTVLEHSVDGVKPVPINRPPSKTVKLFIRRKMFPNITILKHSTQ